MAIVFAIANTYVNIGSANEQIEKYDKALENYFLALAIFEKEEFDKYTALTLNNIAGIYYFENDIENTQINLKKAVEINLRIDNKSGLSNNYFLNGKIFETQNNLDSAVFYMQKTILTRSYRWRTETKDITGNTGESTIFKNNLCSIIGR